MKYIDYQSFDVLNGEGARCVVWLSNCSHGCKGCFNQDSWKNIGEEFDEDMVDRLLKDLSQPFISGITWSGGDPLHKRNYQEVLEISRRIKRDFPDKTIWLYTGYTYDQIKQDLSRDEILKVADVLIDGKYEEGTQAKPFRGSGNQRLLYLDDNGGIYKEE